MLESGIRIIWSGHLVLYNPCFGISVSRIFQWLDDPVVHKSGYRIIRFSQNSGFLNNPVFKNDESHLLPTIFCHGIYTFSKIYCKEWIYKLYVRPLQGKTWVKRQIKKKILITNYFPNRRVGSAVSYVKMILMDSCFRKMYLFACQLSGLGDI